MSEIVIISRGAKAQLDPIGAGFAHGYGIFETIKYSELGLAFWSRHWTRLQRSAKALGFDFYFDETAVLAAIGELIRGDGLSVAMVKLSLLRNGPVTTLYVYARSMTPIPDSVELQLDVLHPINQHSPLSGHKTHNYMEHRLLFDSARKAGFYDTIRVDMDGSLAETTTGNLFFIYEGKLCTPALCHGILPGVVRSAVLDICDTEEGSYAVELLDKAEAVFMTNSAAGILPVSRIVGALSTFEIESASHSYCKLLKASFEAAELEQSVRV
ncbi:MAG: aminotransferase class IV [Opitutaceae bacterium]